MVFSFWTGYMFCSFFILKSMSKIKIVHLLLDPNNKEGMSDENWNSFIYKQNKSIEYFDKIRNLFYSYTQVYNTRVIHPPPIDTCNVPDIYVEYPEQAPLNGAWLSSGHYGAFKSHQNAILNEFNEDIDGLLIVEGDVISDLSPVEFSDKIYRGLKFTEDNNGSFITFANVVFGDGSNAQNEIISFGEWDKLQHFLCCNCYLITKKERKNIQNKLLDAKWMAFDMWLYWNYDKRVPIFRSHKAISYEVSGFSMIDFKEKKSNYLP